jgi:hypothetical protein
MEVLMGKSSINGPFSMAMLNYQRVHQCTYYYSLICKSKMSIHGIKWSNDVSPDMWRLGPTNESPQNHEDHMMVQASKGTPPHDGYLQCLRVMRVMIYSLDDKTVLLARNYHGIYHGIYHGLVKSCGRQVAAVLSEAGDDLRAKADGTSGDFVVEAVGMTLR